MPQSPGWGQSCPSARRKMASSLCLLFLSPLSGGKELQHGQQRAPCCQAHPQGKVALARGSCMDMGVLLGFCLPVLFSFFLFRHAEVSAAAAGQSPELIGAPGSRATPAARFLISGRLLRTLSACCWCQFFNYPTAVVYSSIF